MIQNALLEKYTADTQGLNVGALKTSTIKVNDAIGIGWLPLFTFATAVAVLRERAAGAMRPLVAAFAVFGN